MQGEARSPSPAGRSMAVMSPSNDFCGSDSGGLTHGDDSLCSTAIAADNGVARDSGSLASSAEEPAAAGSLLFPPASGDPQQPVGVIGGEAGPLLSPALLPAVSPPPPPPTPPPPPSPPPFPAEQDDGDSGDGDCVEFLDAQNDLVRYEVFKVWAQVGPRLRLVKSVNGVHCTQLSADPVAPPGTVTELRYDGKLLYDQSGGGLRIQPLHRQGTMYRLARLAGRCWVPHNIPNTVPELRGSEVHVGEVLVVLADEGLVAEALSAAHGCVRWGRRARAALGTRGVVTELHLADRLCQRAALRHDDGASMVWPLACLSHSRESDELLGDAQRAAELLGLSEADSVARMLASRRGVRRYTVGRLREVVHAWDAPHPNCNWHDKQRLLDAAAALRAARSAAACPLRRSPQPHTLRSIRRLLALEADRSRLAQAPLLLRACEESGALELYMYKHYALTVTGCTPGIWEGAPHWQDAERTALRLDADSALSAHFDAVAGRGAAGSVAEGLRSAGGLAEWALRQSPSLRRIPPELRRPVLEYLVPVHTLTALQVRVEQLGQPQDEDEGLELAVEVYMQAHERADTQRDRLLTKGLLHLLHKDRRRARRSFAQAAQLASSGGAAVSSRRRAGALPYLGALLSAVHRGGAACCHGHDAATGSGTETDDALAGGAAPAPAAFGFLQQEAAAAPPLAPGGAAVAAEAAGDSLAAAEASGVGAALPPAAEPTVADSAASLAGAFVPLPDSNGGDSNWSPAVAAAPVAALPSGVAHADPAGELPQLPSPVWSDNTAPTPEPLSPMSLSQPQSVPMSPSSLLSGTAPPSEWLSERRVRDAPCDLECHCAIGGAASPPLPHLAALAAVTEPPDVYGGCPLGFSHKTRWLETIAAYDDGDRGPEVEIEATACAMSLYLLALCEADAGAAERMLRRAEGLHLATRPPDEHGPGRGHSPPAAPMQDGPASNQCPLVNGLVNLQLGLLLVAQQRLGDAVPCLQVAERVLNASLATALLCRIARRREGKEAAHKLASDRMASLVAAAPSPLFGDREPSLYYSDLARLAEARAAVYWSAEDLELALGKAPKRPSLHQLRAAVLADRGQVSAALACLSRSVRFTYQASDLLLRAKLHLRAGDEDAAATDLSACLLFQPSNRTAAKAQRLLRGGRTYTVAELRDTFFSRNCYIDKAACLYRWLQLAPHSPHVYCRVSQFFFRLGNKRNVHNVWCRKAIACCPPQWRPLFRGLLAESARDYARAAALFREAVRNLPHEYECHLMLAYTLVSLRQYDASTQVLRCALHLASHPSHFSIIYNNIGYNFRCTKQYHKALAYFEKSKEFIPHLHYTFFNPFSNASEIYLMMGEHRKAAEEIRLGLRSAIEVRPSMLEELLTKAAFTHPEELLQLCAQIKQLDPYNEFTYRYGAAVMWDTGSLSSGLKELDEGVELTLGTHALVMRGEGLYSFCSEGKAKDNAAMALLLDPHNVSALRLHRQCELRSPTVL
eukprot:TRINITY_DN551_c0_g2_i1.p1 TRINITY_DN551_c0_g2~~TRINITY_DN551_c0_g2_i1.p1  ORF type:complete len:1509 (+),score=386.92 TRINITY_DN551_c0_g2_i1:83-4528(+)